MLVEISLGYVSEEPSIESMEIVKFDHWRSRVYDRSSDIIEIVVTVIKITPAHFESLLLKWNLFDSSVE